MKKNTVFDWNNKQQYIINILKIYLMLALVLQFINYNKNTEDIILATDVSLTEWEADLMQIDKKTKKRHSIQYENNL